MTPLDVHTMTGAALLRLAAGWGEGAIVCAYALAQALLVLYASHRWTILWRRRRAPALSPAPPPPLEWPCVTVQLPVYNERAVAGRLIDAVAALDYPGSRLEIQVLDDSTDGTRSLVAAAVARHAARGVAIHHLARDHREGFKAGALAAGLARARGELVGVFDADFLPAPDFLRRAVPHFSDPGVGMVQARWGHLNRSRSLLTAAQAVMLDSHFLLEHDVRMREGLFFNFNGTAGVWRRSCVEAAGGWSHDTLTEDLDLSYRAQLAGWRFVFDPAIESPAELPADMEAFKSQQRRWSKGSIQTARKVLPRVFASRLPLAVKLEALVHLTSNATYPLLLALSLLLLPVLVGPGTLPAAVVWALQAGVIALGVLPVSLFLAAAQRELGSSRRRTLRDVAGAIVLGVGLSVNNARAVVEGLGRRIGDWERTPKSGDLADRAPGSPLAAGERRAGLPGGLAEAALAVYFAALLAFALAAGYWSAVPFALLLAAGFGWVGLGSLRTSLAAPGPGAP